MATVTLQCPTGVGSVIGRSGTVYNPDSNNEIAVAILSGDIPPLLDAGCLPMSSSGVAARNNLAATSDPAVTNDGTQDYGAGSIWINTSGHRVWVAESVGTGAAVWTQPGTTINLGTGTATFHPEGFLSTQSSGAGVGTGADTTEDVLFTYSLPASTLVAAGKGLRIRAGGKTGATANNKTMKLYFGANVITTPTAATNAKGWFLELNVFRTGTGTQVCHGTGIVDTTAVTPYVATGTETETGAIVVKITGTNGTAAANDVLANYMTVEAIN